MSTFLSSAYVWVFRKPEFSEDFDLSFAQFDLSFDQFDLSFGSLALSFFFLLPALKFAPQIKWLYFTKIEFKVPICGKIAEKRCLLGVLWDRKTGYLQLFWKPEF